MHRFLGITVVTTAILLGVPLKQSRAGLRHRRTVGCISTAYCATTPPATSISVVPSPVTNRPRLKITEQVIIRRRLPDGRIEQSSEMRTRDATTSEEVGILLERLQQLDQDVFGAQQNRQPPLERRVNTLELKP